MGGAMEFGVCGNTEMAAAAAAAGFDFFESNVGSVLCPREDDTAFRKALAPVREAPIPCRVLNCFIPGDLKITGLTVDPVALRDYVETACRRAREAGVATIVFGSGGARAVPDGFDRGRAWEQILDFTGMAADAAHGLDLTIVVEPLCRNDCNVLTSVAESARLVRAIDRPEVRLLVDSYHFLRDGDSLDDLAACGELLAHVHVATVANRLPPGAEAADLSGFFQTLRTVGYDGRVSIEAAVDDPAVQLPAALETLRRLCDQA